MVDILFADPDGCYAGMPIWDECRDARLYLGPGPVVAHPPCNLWVNLMAQCYQRYGRPDHLRPAWYPGGTDGGCFESALSSVRRWGGVLEHPAFSHAWAAHGLQRPVPGGWCVRHTAHGREWTCEVWQAAYGHRARKRTWLLYSGKQEPFELRWEQPTGTHQVGWFDRIKPTVGKREASATPVEFRDELIRLAEHSCQTAIKNLS